MYLMLSHGKRPVWATTMITNIVGGDEPEAGSASFGKIARVSVHGQSVAFHGDAKVTGKIDMDHNEIFDLFLAAIASKPYPTALRNIAQTVVKELRKT